MNHRPHLHLDRLEKRYERIVAVEALSLEVAKGEFVGLLGPSGCGKSTTLRMIGGLTPSTAGRLYVDGVDISALPTHRRNMGIVFQSYALFPHMSVARNVAFGLEMRGLARRDVERRVERMLAAVHLDDHGGRKPRQLSGGQQQRVALARALAIEPQLLLLDEPLSNLDAKLREAMRIEIRDIQQSFGITTIFVTHDQTEALAMCDRIVVLRSGRLEQVGTPFEIYERPASAFVAEFVGRANRLAGLRTGDGELVVGDRRLASRHGDAGPVSILIRPHRLLVAPPGSRPPGLEGTAGRVSAVTFVGDVVQYDVATDIGRLLVELPTRGTPPAHAPGEAVEIGWRAEDLLVFPGSGAAER